MTDKGKIGSPTMSVKRVPSSGEADDPSVRAVLALPSLISEPLVQWNNVDGPKYDGFRWVHEICVVDQSTSKSNPSQRKKGACKLLHILLTVHYGDQLVKQVHIPVKCDARKSFSNASFHKHYQRDTVAVVPLHIDEQVQRLIFTVEQKIQARDGKSFVGMAKIRNALNETQNTKHPLLAFAAGTVYKINVFAPSNEVSPLLLQPVDVHMEVLCTHPHLSATVTKTVSHINSLSYKHDAYISCKMHNNYNNRLEEYMSENTDSDPYLPSPKPCVSTDSFVEESKIHNLSQYNLNIFPVSEADVCSLDLGSCYYSDDDTASWTSERSRRSSLQAHSIGYLSSSSDLSPLAEHYHSGCEDEIVHCNKRQKIDGSPQFSSLSAFDFKYSGSTFSPVLSVPFFDETSLFSLPCDFSDLNSFVL